MTPTPRILVTNDDGYTAEGIRVLVTALEPLGEVWLVAPDREQSAVSHALTLDRPLRMERVGERAFAVDGTPTDCVTLAIERLLADRPPALVVSGINRGGNMGADVHYSGTVSAAVEGVILGLPALAVSQESWTAFTYQPAAALAHDLAVWILRHGLPKNTLLNVNLPAREPLGVRLTRLGTRRYTEGVIEQVDPRGRQIFWIGGGQPMWEAEAGTDFHEVGSGFASVTPLSLDMTDFGFLEELEKARPSWVVERDGRV